MLFCLFSVGAVNLSALAAMHDEQTGDSNNATQNREPFYLEVTLSSACDLAENRICSDLTNFSHWYEN